jgi:Fe-S-cluster-containing hydrogenase component 2/CRP-like cAMP-binding protein
VENIVNALEGIPGANRRVIEQHLREGAARKGIHFFAVRYEPGTVIMAKGTTSDYAALHLSGCVRVFLGEVERQVPAPSCLNQPLRRRLENLVLNSGAEGAEAAPPRALDKFLASLYWRLPGLPLWLVDFTRRRGQWWGGERRATRLEDHIARILRGRPGTVRRGERELAKPPQFVRVAPGSAGNGGETDAGVLIRARVGGELKPARDRLMGVTGALWNQPRSVTLVAENDPEDRNEPCRMLLIKRKVLETIFAGQPGSPGPEFLAGKLGDYVNTSLSDALVDNRLFFDSVYLDQVESWDALLTWLRGVVNGTAAAAHGRFARHLDPGLKEWLRRLPPPAPGQAPAAPVQADKTRVVSALNKFLARRDLLPDALSEQGFPSAVREEVRRLLDGRRPAPTRCESFRLNRLFLEAACPGAFAARPQPWPLFRADFKQFVEDLKAVPEKIGEKRSLRPVLYKKEAVVYNQEEEADALYLILSGMVRVSRNVPGGVTVANNLQSGGYFGEGAAADVPVASIPDVAADVAAPAGDGPPALGPPRRSGTVQALCDSYILVISRGALKELERRPEYSALLAKLRSEHGRVVNRDELFDAGKLVPSLEVPPAIADKLVLTRNILLIDMDRCTRCDQCVRGCAAAHDGQPRFHRANPEYRFGKWEVAGACMHCLDAPCLMTCPVGAITFLEDKAVQIHRDRCIGCTQCSEECPFHVIDMYPPTSRDDAPNLAKPKFPNVANKCDLCLSEDRDPPCVAWCPYDAAMRVDPGAIFPGLKGRTDFTDQPSVAVPPRA